MLKPNYNQPCAANEKCTIDKRWALNMHKMTQALPLDCEERSLKFRCLITGVVVEDGVRCHTDGGTLFCIREGIGAPTIITAVQ